MRDESSYCYLHKVNGKRKGKRKIGHVVQIDVCLLPETVIGADARIRLKPYCPSCLKKVLLCRYSLNSLTLILEYLHIEKKFT